MAGHEQGLRESDGGAMSADMDSVFQDENDQRQQMDWQDQQAEMMRDQDEIDRVVLNRVRRGETHYVDFLYLANRLGYNLKDLRLGELK